jgi:hypothetical protein
LPFQGFEVRKKRPVVQRSRSIGAFEARLLSGFRA